MSQTPDAVRRPTHLPKPRGPLSESVLAALVDGGTVPDPPADVAATVAPEDAAITLWTIYELSYRGFAEIDDDREWDPAVVTVRRALERDLEARLRERWPGRPAYDGDFAEALFAEVGAHDGPSLARYVQTKASADQVLELLQLRSIYHLKESDPVSWAVPRLPTTPRAALMELQYDEYGVGRPEALHAQLFADGMAALGLDPTEAAYVDQVPLEILEQNNAMSLFGLNRRLRGAAVGHLAAFEATSSLPSRRMVQGLDRLGLAEEMQHYYREHVEADAVHEQLAARAICGSLLEAEPELEDDVWLGAFTCLDGEDRVAGYLLDRWGAR
ncbi:iron-containing redox enzyme family protein [Nocardioides sp. KR10-350]|uniref:iron-containing redox enzyme family protein n=1 Tax=Nocardioides cheoyonin TaxID=3156615 RepID=UPI0032B4D1AB